jgi:hypothetical protein
VLSFCKRVLFVCSFAPPNNTKSENYNINYIDGRNSNGGKRVNNILVVITFIESVIRQFFLWVVLFISSTQLGRRNMTDLSHSNALVGLRSKFRGSRWGNFVLPPPPPQPPIYML